MKTERMKRLPDSDALLRWFASCGDRYVTSHLGHIDTKLLSSDSNYGLKAFLFGWAFERAGAPRGYRIRRSRL